MQRRLLVGIDLGTTNSTCSVAEHLADGSLGPIEPVPIRQLVSDPSTAQPFGMQPVLPSVVCLREGGQVYTGLYVKIATPEFAATGHRVIRDIKRQMGNPTWQLACGRRFRPRHISALLLATMKRSIDLAFPDCHVERFVLTIPASFSSLMRQETLRAASIAGLDTSRLELLDEPVAALLSQFARQAFDLESNAALVFDMGGGTLDVSLLAISTSSNAVDIQATSRYHDFAGNDIDMEFAALLLNHLRKEPSYNGFLESSSSDHAGRSPVQIALGLLSSGEQIKIKLSQVLEHGPRVGGVEKKLQHFRTNTQGITADLTLDFTADATPTSLVIPAIELIEQIHTYVTPGGREDRDIFVPIHQVLERASIDRPDRIYLAGGSSYFPLVRDALAAYFATSPEMLDPVYAVSHGAVVWAFMKSSSATWRLTETLRDSIFLKRRGHAFLEVFRHPAPIPSTPHSMSFQEEEAMHFPDSGRRVQLEFFQGDSPHDPRLTLCHIENLDFERELGNDARLVKLQAHIDSNKLFHFEMTFQDRDGTLTGSVAFTPDMSDLSPSADESRFLQGIVLNGETL